MNRKPPRPSPSESATLHAAGTRRKGNDGRMYVVAEAKNGVRRWQPQSKAVVVVGRTVKTAKIVDNNGVTFLAKLTSTKGPGTAHIDEAFEDDPDSEGYQYRFWKSLPYDRVFVGLDPSETAAGKKKEPAGIFSRIFGTTGRGSPWWYGGNSLLLRTGPQAYTYVGSEIFAFKVPPGDDIQQYVSEMGNSGVPYPYAVGTRNTYLMLERTWIPNEVLQRARALISDKDAHEITSPYDIYYRYDLGTGKKLGIVQSNRAHKAYVAAHVLASFKVLHERIWW